MSPELPKSKSARQRILDYFIEKGVGSVVTGEELAKVAKIHEWARRVRELRDEYGWEISSSNDRDHLKPGQYILESLTQREAITRGISPNMRIRILSRDGSTCQMCGVGAGEPSANDPKKRVRLQVDHIVPVSHGGDNSEGNFRTCCSDCNEGRSNLYVPESKSISALTLIRKCPENVQRDVFEFLKKKFESI